MTPGKCGDNHLIFTSLCFPWRWGEHSLSFLHPTGWEMSGGFTFDLSVVAFSHRLLIWTFHRNYFRQFMARLPSFRNALQGLVKGFKKGCHSRFYTQQYFDLYSWVTRGVGVGDFTQYFCPSVWELHWLSFHFILIYSHLLCNNYYTGIKIF